MMYGCMLRAVVGVEVEGLLGSWVAGWLVFFCRVVRWCVGVCGCGCVCVVCVVGVVVVVGVFGVVGVVGVWSVWSV